jgi:hypothetical protein
MTDQPTSGDGERAAILGYYPQYVIAADLIYSALLDGSLESVRVADPNAGAVDDIQPNHESQRRRVPGQVVRVCYPIQLQGLD